MIFGFAVTNAVIYVLGGILMAIGLGVTFCVLKQTGKEKGLSGTIAGGANTDTYFGKNQGKSRDKIWMMLTIVGTVVFVALAVLLTILITLD